MIRPIHVFGDPVLREETTPVTEMTPEVQDLIRDMLDTMYGADGVGLAAPQVGREERVFVVDLTAMLERRSAEEIEEPVPAQPMVFINPEILWESEEESEFEEGCLSIPDLREIVSRPERIRIRYRDADFGLREIEVGSLLARVIQHEYDHLEGVLFVDHLSAFRRRMLMRRLREMAKGNVEADYPLALEGSTTRR